jgi:hypothetical protein
MKRFYYFLSGIVLIIVFVSAMAFVNAKSKFPDKHLEVVLRNIGHQLLLHSKDSTSRVLPVKRINERTYQISFENSFGFTPDTLMLLINQQLAKTDMPEDYIVSVNECKESRTIFAYEINKLKGDLKPCGGRAQQTGCYLIQIEFLAEKSFNYAWLLTAFVPIAFIGFYLNRRQNKQEDKGQEEKENVGDEPSASDNIKTIAAALEYQTLGKFRFFETKGILCLNDETVELSEKEIKTLSIFASNQNVVVERDRIMKEIWEDEGVFVIDRNVDVLISKLRKKLSGDPCVKIVNVHGKGYKFMVIDA